MELPPGIFRPLSVKLALEATTPSQPVAPPVAPEHTHVQAVIWDGIGSLKETLLTVLPLLRTTTV